jgi:EAL domain-containing protein (putative c-di-GMP-specific phosphodiesterase class I)/ActR/RegA family two-component response regulator
MDERRDTAGSPRLLVVDDDQMVGETIRLMARREGFAVRFTCEPGRFLELVETWAPDVVAIDLVMPGMDGVQVLKKLAEREFDACIVLTSGVGHRVLDAARRSAREHGLRVVGMLPKPFRHADLREVLSDCTTGACRPGRAPAPRRQVPEMTEEMLAEGLERGQIVPYFQPKIACGPDRRLAGFEALARWDHPEFGQLPPGEFIPLAERSGQIAPLTGRIATASLAWFGGVLSDRPHSAGSLRLSLNLSARMLEQAELLEQVAGDCERFGVPPDALVFELTETAAMADATASLDLLTRMRVGGYHLAIDDFGTGYSSMVQLVRLPFSELKIDKSFLLSARESEESREVVRSVVELGGSLGLTTTAEGVADEWIWDFVCSLGCDYAQGFHLGYPESGDRARELWTL